MSAVRNYTIYPVTPNPFQKAIIEEIHTEHLRGYLEALRFEPEDFGRGVSFHAL